MTSVRSLVEEDLDDVARIHREAFPSDTESLEKAKIWVVSKFRAWPVSQYFVAESDGEVVGYILWMEMGGFRHDAVLELEQIAVGQTQRGRGIGISLIDESLFSVWCSLVQDGRQLKLVEVTTATSNEAQKLYGKTLGATVCCTKPDFFESDEVVMFASKKLIDEVRVGRDLRPLK